MNVTLRTVTIENWRDVASLRVDESQNEYVADNSYSLAEASYRTHCQPRAIYLDENPVGFLMYAGLDPIDQPTSYEIFRLMVDAKHQAKGIGRAAMNLVLDEIKALPNVQSILICYVPTNPIAKSFYGSFGFVETSMDNGEMMAEIKLHD